DARDGGEGLEVGGDQLAPGAADAVLGQDVAVASGLGEGGEVGARDRVAPGVGEVDDEVPLAGDDLWRFGGEQAQEPGLVDAAHADQQAPGDGVDADQLQAVGDGVMDGQVVPGRRLPAGQA